METNSDMDIHSSVSGKSGIRTTNNFNSYTPAVKNPGKGILALSKDGEFIYTKPKMAKKESNDGILKYGCLLIATFFLLLGVGLVLLFSSWVYDGWTRMSDKLYFLENNTIDFKIENSASSIENTILAYHISQMGTTKEIIQAIGNIKPPVIYNNVKSPSIYNKVSVPVSLRQSINNMFTNVNQNQNIVGR